MYLKYSQNRDFHKQIKHLKAVENIVMYLHVPYGDQVVFICLYNVHVEVSNVIFFLTGL